MAEQIQKTHAYLRVEPATHARMARVVAFTYSMRRCRGFVYFRTVQEAANAASILRASGLSVGVETTKTPVKRIAAHNIIVRTSGAHCGEADVSVSYILHAAPPGLMEIYMLDLAAAQESTPPPICIILYPLDDERGVSDVDAYCRSQTCRYAHLVRRPWPAMIEPEPHAFSCHHCDVCTHYPHGVYEEEHGQLVSV